MKEIVVQISQLEEPEDRKLFEAQFTVEVNRGAGWIEEEKTLSKDSEKDYTFRLKENQRLIVLPYLPKAVSYSADQGAAYYVGAQEGLKIDDPISPTAAPKKQDAEEKKKAEEIKEIEKERWKLENPGKEYPEPKDEEEIRREEEQRRREKVDLERKRWENENPGKKYPPELQKRDEEFVKGEEEKLAPLPAAPHGAAAPKNEPQKPEQRPQAQPPKPAPPGPQQPKSPDPNPGLISSREVKGEDKKK